MTPAQYADWLSSPAAEEETREENPRHPKGGLKILEELLMDRLMEEDHETSLCAEEIIRVYRVMTGNHFFADLYHNGRLVL